MKHPLRTIFGLAGALTLLVASGCARTPEPWQPGDLDAIAEQHRATLAPEAAHTLATSPTLHLVVRLAAERNAAVLAASSRWRAAIERYPQSITPPDPMVQAGYQFQSVETRVGPQRFQFGVTQSLPWWRKLWSRGRVALTQADLAALRYSVTLRESLGEAKRAYYELAYLDRALALTRATRELFGNQALLAYGELEAGQGLLSEAWRAETLLARLDYDANVLRDRRTAEADRLRALLGLPPEQAIGPITHAPVYDPVLDLNWLKQRARDTAEMLRTKGLEAEMARHATYQARLSRLPDPSLGVNWIVVDSPAGASPSEAGKDPLIGLLTMNLPLWQWRNSALIEEKQRLEQAAELAALDTADRLDAAVAGAWLRVRTTRRLLELYRQTLAPQARAALEQAEAQHRAGLLSTASLIEATMAWHQIGIGRARAATDHALAINALEQVLGATARPTGNGGQTP